MPKMKGVNNLSDFIATIQTSLDTSNAKSDFESFKKDIQNEVIKISLDADFKGSNANFLNNFSKQMQSSAQSVGQVSGQMFGNSFGSSFNKNVKSVKINNPIDFAKFKKQNQKEISDIAKQMQDSVSGISDKDARKWASGYISERQRKTQEQAEKTAEIISKTQENILNGAYSAKASTLNSKLSPYTNQTDNELINEARRQAELYDSTLTNLQKHFDSNNSFKLNDEEVVQSFNTMEQAAKKFENTMTEIKNTQSKDLGFGVADRSANQVKAYYEENPKALKKYGNELKDLENRYRSISTVAEKADLDNQFKNLKSQISADGLTGKNFIEEIGRSFKQIGQFAETYGVIQQFEELVVDSVSELKDVNTILTEVSKTSNLTTSELKELGETSFDSASEFGKTATDYLTGVQEMSRSGFYGEQAEELARLSILGQAAGDMTADVSNSYLLATNAAYKYNGSVEKLNATLDGQNMITNRNSVSMDDMAQATTEAASMAAQAGVEVDELSAIIGTAVSRTKESGSEVGTALKSLFVNLQNTQSSKIVDTFDSVGISMTEMVGDSKLLKTPIELLRELAEVYNSLPDGSEQKANILTNIGGKYHANTLSSILVGIGEGDFDSMLQDYSEGLGSAAVEAEKSANNWEGSTNKLKNSWTDLVANFADSEAIIGSTNILNSLVSGIDNVTESLGTLKTIGLGLGLFQGVKGSGKPDKYRIWIHKEYVYATEEFSGDVCELCVA